MSFENASAILNKIGANFQDFAKATPPSGSIARLINNDGVLLRFTGLKHPFFNAVISTRLTENNLAEKIKQTLDFASSNNVPLLWWVFPSDQPSNLQEELVKRGLFKINELPAMAVQLAELNIQNPVIPNFEIKRVKDLETLKSWCEVMVEAIGIIPKPFTSHFTDIYIKTTMENAAKRVHYLGLYEGQPIATCAINLTGDEVAGVFNVSTLPEFRQKGIGRAITLLPLLEARQAGYRLGTLLSSEMGLKVYKSLGFKEYGKVYQYLAPAAD